VITPVEATGRAALTAVEQIAELCGALPVHISPHRHDAAMAVLSHLPQLLASLLAADAGQLSDEELALAGQGFRDVTRLADSDPQLWAQIIEGNREEVAAAARRLADVLLPAVTDNGPQAVARLVADGNAGRSRLPDKIGPRPHAWEWVGVVVQDRPGELANLFAAVAKWDVNVEDIHVEHSRNAPFGRLELAVDARHATELVDRLAGAGWVAYQRS
jgi:prephenate dehydrogenase